MTNKRRSTKIHVQFSENDLKSGDDGIEETLLPIPNRKVKLYSANGTAWETVWESRTLPGPIGSLAQLVRATGS